ncbi:glycopeptide [Trametes versicolor FP-101664 SS1]|uniref:glycopeptide n=1 Tax=Trametes versicolor (strain FP-101664) TaxID=717944 RepID=UPI00046241D7|nr:glycopeptide [Trametes versicolor FP-101664 SS1]EIW52330.1 glycopeptide [Trametes versicolor FP-101664 SS1]
MHLSDSFIVSVAVAVCASTLVSAEGHLRIIYRCGSGTPTLVQGGRVLSTGGDFVSNGPLNSAVAYLQTGQCGFDGQNCAAVEMTLANPSDSFADISLIPPHAFNVGSVSFRFFGTCSGFGATCASAGCGAAMHSADDTGAIVFCGESDVNLLVEFCV